MLDIHAALTREPDVMRLSKLDKYIEEALRKSSGQPHIAFEMLIVLAEKESELGDLVSDVMALAFSRHFYRVCEDHLRTTPLGDIHG